MHNKPRRRAGSAGTVTATWRRDRDGHVEEGLYRQTTCIRYPTLAIINLTDINSPWVQADIQTRYVLRVYVVQSKSNATTKIK